MFFDFDSEFTPTQVVSSYRLLSSPTGVVTREQFDAWKDEATAKRLDVETGILDMDEYATWLKNNRI